MLTANHMAAADMRRLPQNPSWGLLLLPLALLGLWGAWRLDSEASIPVETAGVDALGAYPWIYQRGSSPEPGGATFDVILVGDVQAGRDGKASLPLEIPAEFQAADLLVGNLEGVIAAMMPAPEATYAPYRLAASPHAASQLGRLGFDLLSLANNHALDLGPEGLADTAQNLEWAGISFFGAGADPQQTQQPIFRQVGSLRLAFLAVTALPPPGMAEASAGWRPAVWQEGVAETVRQARQQVDLVIVLVHWGYEYQTAIDPAQRAIARSLLAAGADLVVGQHPHVVQGLELISSENRFNPQVVAYSLGNFWFPQETAGTNQGLALRVALDSQGIWGVQALPLSAGQGVGLGSPAEAQAAVQRLLQPAPPLVFQCNRQSCTSVDPADLAARQTGAGIFWSGSIDLTGDAQPELVRRENGQIIVYEAGQEPGARRPNGTSWMQP